MDDRLPVFGTMEKLYMPRAAVAEQDKGGLAGSWIGPRGVAKLAHSAGFRDDDLFMSVAVCGAESWLYTRAWNVNPNGSKDVGLWQIDIQADEIGTQAEEELYDPQTNADRAFELWHARGWEPWVSFTTNTYLHDTYRLWAMLGVGNRWEEHASALAAAASVASTVQVPALSIPTARKLWPHVPLG